MKMNDDLWRKISEVWYKKDFNTSNSMHVKNDYESHEKYYDKVIKIHEEFDWNKDDGLDF